MICKPGPSGHFFTRVDSLTCKFHQEVLFVLLFVSPTRLRPQQIAADGMTAFLSKHHLISMSSVKLGSFLNLPVQYKQCCPLKYLVSEKLTLETELKNNNHSAVRVSLSANGSHMNGQVFFIYLVAYLSSYHEKAINALYELA